MEVICIPGHNLPRIHTFADANSKNPSRDSPLKGFIYKGRSRFSGCGVISSTLRNMEETSRWRKPSTKSPGMGALIREDGAGISLRRREVMGRAEEWRLVSRLAVAQDVHLLGEINTGSLQSSERSRDGHLSGFLGGSCEWFSASNGSSYSQLTPSPPPYFC